VFLDDRAQASTAESHRAAEADVSAPVAIAGRVSAAVFATLSAVRHRRVFHPLGASYTGRLVVDGHADAPFGAALLDTPAERECIVRFSRGAGMHEPLPDILGMGLRILGPEPCQPQDLLLVTAGERPLFRHLFLPTPSYTAHHYSSVVPYRVGGRTRIFGAEPLASTDARTLDDLTALLVAGNLDFVLQAATPTGPWQRIGAITLDRRMEPDAAESLRFDVANRVPDVEPVGVLNQLRRRTYPASQHARLAVRGRGRS
jgi:hypothetical protein